MRAWRILWLAPLFAAASAPPSSQPADEVYLDEVKDDFLERIRKCEEARDWKGLFEHYAHGLRRYARKVVVVKARPGGASSYVSLAEYLTGRLSALPREAYEYYRLEYDGRAKAAFEKAREAGDRAALEKAVEDYFFSSAADEALDFLASRAFDEGRVQEAIFHWNRLLRFYPDSDLPPAVTAARLAHAGAAAGDEALLQSLRAWVAAKGLAGEVAVGGRRTALAAYLAGLNVSPAPRPRRPVPFPDVPDAADGLPRRGPAAGNDIRRWTYDFAADRGAETPAAPASVENLVVLRGRRVVVRGGESAPAPPYGDFPLIPAAARLGGKDYVLVTDGSRVVAFDPARVRGSSTTAGVYWKYPRDGSIVRGPSPNAGGLVVNRPLIGAAVDGEYAYVTMYSDLRTRPREGGQLANDPFEGTTSLKCLHIPTGRCVWDTDLPPLRDAVRAAGKEFFDRNFSFSSPPVVDGDRLYVGICTSPLGEQESRVLCLDKKTGRPLWTTFLASVNLARLNALGWGPARLSVSPTLLTVHGGTVYAQTNLGVVAALNGVSGHVLWLTRYPRRSPRVAGGMVETPSLRPSNAPVVWKGRVFVLPQDAEPLLVFEAREGSPVEWRVGSDRLVWNSIHRLQGVVETESDDWLVATGTQSFVIRLSNGAAHELTGANVSQSGRGAIAEGLLYLPVSGPAGGDPAGALAVYDLWTWKTLERRPWREAGEGGNLLVAGRSLVAAGSKVAVYADAETLRAEFARRLGQSPPHAESFLEFGDLMRQNGRLEEAAEAYLGFVRAAEGDPRHEARARQVRGELHAIFLRRGDEAAGAVGDTRSLHRALEFYRTAREFAYDAESEALATRKMAETYERLERWKDAVTHWQRLLEGGRELYRRESEQAITLWEHARRRIEEIVTRAPDAYDEVERRAAEALRQAEREGADALRGILERFPNSRSARDAWRRLRDLLREGGSLERLRGLYDEFRDRFKTELPFDAYQDLLELLEKLGDWERFGFELGKFAERFPDEKMSRDGGATVREYVERRRRELGARPAERVHGRGLPARTAELEAIRPPAEADGAGLGHWPLRPRGIEPPGFSAALELFVRGSSVELWDLKRKQRLWAAPCPGGYLGVQGRAASEESFGVRLTDVRSGSPAQEAGLAPGDLLVEVDGKPADEKTLEDIGSRHAPGEAVEIVLRRGDRAVRTRVMLGGHPPDRRPVVVGAAFTRDYGLAVAWEDRVAWLDPATGRARWVFRGLRPSCRIQAFHATDGRLYLLEAPDSPRGTERGTREVRSGTDGDGSEAPFDRLLCLSDATGQVLWARVFERDAEAPAGARILFLGPYLSDAVTFLLDQTRSGNRELSVWKLAAEAREGRVLFRRPLQGQVQAFAAEPDGSYLYYVTDLTNDRRERMLYGMPIERGRKPMEIALQARHLPPGAGACGLSVLGPSVVCLSVSPAQPGGDYRLCVFRDGREVRLQLPEGRTLPAGRPIEPPADREGILYVYNVPREGGGPGSDRAFLTALRGEMREGEDPLVWDAPAPVLGAGPSVAWAVLPEENAFVVFSASHAAVPGQAPEGGVAVVYDKARGGYLHLAHTDLSVPADPAGASARPPAELWRGRLYVSAREAVQVYGE
ncbi:MAG TPA: PQQ-binding-like beta-propeller repeat protein [Planctomycetota bacterium]|nr:PQQ-binding-like beta-propeller repeat protein [Planctomycetota bacterium]